MLQFLGSELGSKLARYGLGCLYISYSASALLFAASVVDWLGTKPALVFSMALYSVYVAAYWSALSLEQQSRLQWAVIMTGAAIGGFAAGVVWTAEGKYFSASAEQYARASRKTVQHATAYFSGVFAACYLGLEVLLKLLASLPFRAGTSAGANAKSSPNVSLLAWG